MDGHVNPFRYGGVVGSNDFCNREKEIRDLRKSVAYCDRLFLYGERRIGKTSLARRVLEELPKRSYLTVYVDLWPTDDASSFARTLAKSLSETGARRADHALETARTFFGHLKPSLKLDLTGNPSLQFDADRYLISESELEHVLQAPQRLAEHRGKKLAVVFDEFQRILEYADNRVERMLSAAVPDHTHVAYLFSGSRKHLVGSRLLDSSRPFYRSAGHCPLKAIEAGQWMKFISERFETTGRVIQPEVIELLVSLSEGHPYYTQHLAHSLWELTAAEEKASPVMLDRALDLLLERESHAYSTLWDSLTSNQQRLLRGLAAPGRELPPFSGEFAKRFGLATPANVQSASRGLLKRDVIAREEGALVIVDRFFRLWVSRTF